jgi:regulator of replication initiation timing
LGGVGLAFVPIEERPMDVWVLSFIKSIYSPTQYIWSKKTQPSQTPALEPVKPITSAVQPVPTQQAAVLQNIFIPPQITHTHVPKKGLFDQISNLWEPKAKIVPPIATPTTRPIQRMDFSPPPIVKPTVNAEKILKDTQKKEIQLEDKVKTLETELQGKATEDSRIVELQSQLTEILTEREKMRQELDTLRKQSMPPPTATSTQTLKIPTIQIIQPGSAVKAGLPRLTTFPNIVTGIVKDKDKNLLPGVLVTVKDKDGIPLRALKTNRLGQFAASTQLPNGTYLIEIEDPRLRFTFDRAQITLNGTIVPALEIFAKTEKEITRAKLEKELFGKPDV